jgi:hypothetical protein
MGTIVHPAASADDSTFFHGLSADNGLPPYLD